VRQRQHAAYVVAAGQFGHHAAIGLVHVDLAEQRVRQQARHAAALGTRQRNACFIASDSKNSHEV
jgi:hypothetical protein